MTDILRFTGAVGGRVRSAWLALLMAIAALALALNATAQAPVAPSGAALPPAAESLDALVGRIALYPDDLVAVILPASTNPLQIVQADRFLEKRKTEPKLPLDDKWDDAVKTLLNYPDIVKSMSADLDWTSALGEAVVADLGAVMEAVQAFRRKAQAAGNLKSDDKQVVVVEKEVITIAPADPQVIYVPQYNPSTVVVYSASPYYYGYYPTPYPSYYYPYAPGAAFAAGVIWGAAIGAAWNGGHYASHYGGNNNININRNTNINTGNIGGGANQRPAGGGGSSQWKSNKQPGQVSSSVGKTAPSSRVGDARGGGAGGASTRPSTGATGGASTRPSAGATGGASTRPSTGATGGASTRPSTGATGGASTRPSGGSAGAASTANRSSGSSGAAFSSYGSGRQASSNSSRGASSSRSMSSGGGGARGGGGGGGRGGGGRR
jgi:Protein of unknown function (DUF3300)